MSPYKLGHITSCTWRNSIFDFTSKNEQPIPSITNNNALFNKIKINRCHNQQLIHKDCECTALHNYLSSTRTWWTSMVRFSLKYLEIMALCCITLHLTSLHEEKMEHYWMVVVTVAESDESECKSYQPLS